MEIKIILQEKIPSTILGTALSPHLDAIMLLLYYITLCIL